MPAGCQPRSQVVTEPTGFDAQITAVFPLLIATASACRCSSVQTASWRAEQSNTVHNEKSDTKKWTMNEAIYKKLKDWWLERLSRLSKKTTENFLTPNENGGSFGVTLDRSSGSTWALTRRDSFFASRSFSTCSGITTSPGNGDVTRLQGTQEFLLVSISFY